MSCIFTPCYLVCHFHVLQFHVRHFQPPWFVSNSLCHNTVDTYKMDCANVENLWIEVLKQNKKYIIGGVYRHPNSNVKEFTSELDCVLSNVNRWKTPCVLADDFNIDLSKIEVNVDTLNYV